MSSVLDHVRPGTTVKFELPPTTNKALRLILELAIGFRVPNVRACDGHTSPFEALADAFFARAPVSVWKGSRGLAGKTMLMGGLSWAEGALLGAKVMTLGGSGQQSARVLEALSGFWAHPNAPRHLLASEPAARHMRLRNGGTITALMASQTSVRGPHPQRLRIDEVDEVDMPILDAALGQAMSSPEVPSHVVLSSTHHHADGTFTEVLKRAAERGWPVYEWCWRETLEPHGWLSEEQVRRTRATMSKQAWENEVELGEPSPDSRAIDTEAVTTMFTRELGEWDGANDEYIEVEPPLLEKDEESGKIPTYATGADWATKKDWTIITTLRTDVRPMRLVAFERKGRMPYPVMIDALNARLARYPGPASHDATGVGVAVSGYLTHWVENLTLVGRHRTELLSEYIAAVERGEIVAPLIVFAEREHRTASVEDVYGPGHLPDTICSGALAYRAAVHGGLPSIS